MTSTLKTALFAALAAAALASPAHASEKVTVTNKVAVPVRFYFTALGCAGVQDGRNFVCHHETIQPGKQGSYTFKAGTSDRFVKSLNVNCNDKLNSGWKVTGTSHDYTGC